MSDDFDLRDFTPYLLNQAAEVTSLAFQRHYRGRYGMLRNEWRVLFHLGRYGDMSARDICTRARLHKTKVSRAVSALAAKRYLTRARDEGDRRVEVLSLTAAGVRVFRDLYAAAQAFDAELIAPFTAQERDVLRRCLARLSQPDHGLV